MTHNNASINHGDAPAQYYVFKDCLARCLLAHLDSQSLASKDTLSTPSSISDSTSDDPSDLDDFSSYLSSECWSILPTSFQSATYETRDTVPDTDTFPLGARVSPAFVDTLVSYGITTDAEEAVRFLRRVLQGYVEEACAPPPVWSSTRTTECELCEREVPLTYHHLIPRSTHAKVLKRKWHPESMLNSVAWLCRPCHSAVHHVARNEELAKDYYTLELLLQREDIQRWRKYASKQRWGVRRG
ncbi:hypothetical protein AMATHDRAFT_151078 [Amanita thiersii Skay4041]|uniref:HNH domain-containing protein n=1 Tax=Amanita thiersii Skay4041 TaxID=703135 RepID=A0A2A9NA12_9AGAR|nr:hypothetical protein AMATHDRAFT_151078 [Amanita thiersii Skay4041]